MTRVRHYTRRGRKDKILAEGRIVARDQNKVFVERAASRRLPPRDAERHYQLERGKGAAYVEFDVEEHELASQYNPSTRLTESFGEGDVLLAGRNPEGFNND